MLQHTRNREIEKSVNPTERDHKRRMPMRHAASHGQSWQQETALSSRPLLPWRGSRRLLKSPWRRLRITRPALIPVAASATAPERQRADAKASGKQPAAQQSAPESLGHGNGSAPQQEGRVLTELRRLAQQPKPNWQAAAQLLTELTDCLRGAPPSQLQLVKRHPAPGALLAALASESSAAADDLEAGGSGHDQPDPAVLSRLLQAFARLQLKPARPQLQSLGTLVAAAVPSGRAGDVVYAAWSLSRLGFCSPAVLAAIEERALASSSWLETVNADGLTSLLWVLNRASHASPALLDEVLRRLAAAVGAHGPTSSSSGRASSDGNGGNKALVASRKEGFAEQQRQGELGQQPHNVELPVDKWGAGVESARSRARQVSLALHSVASMHHTPSEATLASLCAQARQVAPSADPQGLCNIAWALGRMGHRDPALMEGVAQAALGKLDAFSLQELALLASGFGGMGHRHGALLTAVADQMVGGSALLSPRDISHLLTSLGNLSCRPSDATLAALDRQAAALLRQHSSTRARSAAAGRGGTGRQRQQQRQQQQQQALQQKADKGSLQPGAAAAAGLRGQEQQGGEPGGSGGGGGGAGEGGAFPPATLCWTLWGFARLGFRPRELLRGLDEVWGRAPGLLYSLGAEDASRLMWALTKLGHRSGAVLQELALVFRNLLPSMPPQSLAMALHGYAQLGHTPHELLDGAAEHMAGRLKEYPPQSVATMVWAFARLQAHPGRGLPGGGFRTPLDDQPLLDAVEAFAVGHADQLGPQSMAMLCWGLASLHHHPSPVFLKSVTQHLVQHAERAAQHTGQGQHAAQQGGHESLGDPYNSPEGLQGLAADPPEGRNGAAAVGLQQRGGSGSPLLHSYALVAWAYAQWKHVDLRFFGAVRSLLALDTSASLPTAADRGKLQGSPAPTTVSNLAFALAKLGIRDEELVEALGQAAVGRLHMYNSQELVNLLWCHAAVGVQPEPAFLAECVEALAPQLPTCDASLAALAVHSLAMLRYAPPDAWMEAAVECVASTVLDELPEDAGADDLEGDEQGDGVEEGREAAGGVGRGQQQGQQQDGVVVGPPAEDGLPLGQPLTAVAAAAMGLAAQAAAGQQQQQRQRQAGGGGAASNGSKPHRESKGGVKGKGSARGAGRQQRGLRLSSVHVTLLSKLLWGCAHLGYKPPQALLQPLLAGVEWALAGARTSPRSGRTSPVLHVVDMVMLLWALAVLEQYHSALYSSLCSHTSHLPRGTPREQAMVQLLRQVVMLSGCEAQFVSMQLRGSNILPEWLREGQQQHQQGGGKHGRRGEGIPKKSATPGGGAAGALAASDDAATGPTKGAATSRSPGPGAQAHRPVRNDSASAPSGAADVAQAGPAGTEHLVQPAQQHGESEGGKEAAEALAAALRSAGCKPVDVRQLLFGEWVVMYRLRDSGQAAVLPWLPAQRAVNDPDRALGSALATLRVLAAKGFPVVVGAPQLEATVAECLNLWT